MLYCAEENPTKQENLPYNCNQIGDKSKSYTIQSDNGYPVDIYCDMEEISGNWILLFNYKAEKNESDPS